MMEDEAKLQLKLICIMYTLTFSFLIICIMRPLKLAFKTMIVERGSNRYCDNFMI